MLRPDTVFLTDSGFVKEVGIAEGPSRPGVEHLDTFRDQLHRIGVTGNDNGIDTLFRGLSTEAAEDVIGFIAVELVRRHVKGIHQMSDPAHLLD